MTSSQVRLPPAHASRYLQQLCKRWSHSLAVAFDENQGAVTFPRNAGGAGWPGDATMNPKRPSPMDKKVQDVLDAHHTRMREEEKDRVVQDGATGRSLRSDRRPAS